MKKEKIRAFISSTKEDLQDEREAVMEKLTRIDIPFAGMEYFGSDDRLPIKVIIEKIEQCDIYIGIVGSRYGSLVPNETKSYTEFEYDYASVKGLSRLIYIKKTSGCSDSDECSERQDRLEKFRERLKSNHTVSFFAEANELAASVLGDLFNPLFILLFNMPILIEERAKKALSEAREYLNKLNNQRTPRQLAQNKAREFFSNYRFRFDGQFTVINTERKVIFHDISKATGLPYESVHPEFDRIIENFVIGKSEDCIKWIDQLSSDYLLIDDALYSGHQVIDWLRFNKAPFTYFQPWDWYILAEAHNEIHGLEEERIEIIFEDFRKKGWLIVKGLARLPKSVRD